MVHKYLVTGAGGFVGQALARALLRRGHVVIGIGRKPSPELIRDGIEWASCDLQRDAEVLEKACRGVDAVFHVAAKVDMWGPFEEFYRSNVLGTQVVIGACQRNHVPRLIYTSSPSVIADGSNLRNINESYPYPRDYTAYYPATKALAERSILAANKEGVLHTIALRPHLIFGPGDRHFVPTILERARQRRLVRVGSGTNLTDVCFIEDCVAAHLLALDALDRNSQSHGKAYFISQSEPVSMWGWISEVLRLANCPPITRSVPRNVAMGAAALMETLSRVSGGRLKPQFTRFLVSQMTTDHYFDISRARNDLGFQPSCSVAEALTRTFA